MSKTMRYSILKSIMILILAVFFSINGYTIVHGNWGECPFEPGCIPGGGDSTSLYITESGSLMGMYITEGAGYILGAYSGAGAFLKQAEVSELYGADFAAIKNILDRMIDDLENARDTYFIINYIAAITPYKKDVIERLVAFDYDGFEKSEGLSGPVFDRVERFLKCGNIRGVFAKILRDIDSLLYQSYILKKIIDSNTLPDVKSLWKLNQSFTDTILFGQYFSQVLYEVK
jgi:hypothetical protein